MSTKNQTDVELFEGYVYTDVTLSPCDHPTRPWISHDNPRPIRWMEDEVLEGREIQLRLKKANARWKGGRVFYAFKMDFTPEGRKEARALCRQDPQTNPKPSRAAGVLRMRRMNAQYRCLEETYRVLDKQTDAYQISHYLVKMALAWHAQTFGPGPLSEAASAVKEQHKLEQALPAAMILERTRKPRL